jgi:hypothetical protein
MIHSCGVYYCYAGTDIMLTFEVLLCSFLCNLIERLGHFRWKYLHIKYLARVVVSLKYLHWIFLRFIPQWAFSSWGNDLPFWFYVSSCGQFDVDTLWLSLLLHHRNDYEMLLALDTDNDAHRGASQESIGLLPVTTIAVCISPIGVFVAPWVG